MISERQIFQAVMVEYTGSPSITVSVDGGAVLSNTVLPTQSTRQTRIVTLPPTAVGYTPHFSSNDNLDTRTQFIPVPEKQFKNQHIFSYYEVTFTGSIRVQIYNDQTKVLPSLKPLGYIDLSVRGGKSQDTVKVYYPALSYGYVPHIEQIYTDTLTGHLISYNAVTLPTRFHKGLSTHSEWQITYRDDCQIVVYLDGKKVVDQNLPEQIIPQDGGYTTFKDYFPEDTTGHVLQYVKSSGDGEVAVFETDQTLIDLEQPQQEVK